MERVTLTLQHKEADHVPVYPLINSISRQALGLSYAEWTQNEEKCAEAILKTTDMLDVDCMCTIVDLSLEAADWGQEIVYPEKDAAHPAMDNRLIKSVDDYKNIDIINPRETPRMSGNIRLANMLSKAKGNEKPLIGFVFGPLGILSMLRSQEKMFLDLIKNPDTLHPALQAINETLKEFCKALIEAGCQAIMLDTLYASKSIMGPKMWDDFEGIYVEDLCNSIRKDGGMVMLHNCGNGVYFEKQIKRMDPILISYQHMPPDCETLKDIKEKYGSKITLFGHIEPGWLCTATEEEVRAACREQIDAYKKDGGYILATGCEYPSNLDFRFAEIMVEEAKTYGKY